MNTIRKIKISEIAKITKGKLTGKSDIVITGANTLESAVKGEVSFLANPKYKKWLSTTNASCVLVADTLKVKSKIPLIKVENPMLSFSKVISELYGQKRHPVSGISKKAQLGKSVKCGAGVKIGDFTKIENSSSVGAKTIIYPNVYIGRDTKIGKNCIIFPNVTIKDSVVLGDNVIVHSGTVIGSDGFGYSTVNGKHNKIPQVGGVVIGNDVEIGANVCIDRGSPGDTIIGEGTKIDNLVQIAHNVKIGKGCMIISQVGIAGSTIVGDYVVFAGQAGVVGHITIGSGAQIGAQAGVTRNVKPMQLVSGYPAMEHRQARKINALVKKLPQLFKDVELITKKFKKKRK